MIRSRARIRRFDVRTGRLGLAFLVAVSLLGGGCSVGPGTGATADSSPGRPAATGPSASVPDTGEAPITYPADNMWALLATMPGLQRRSETLAQAVAFSDAVIVGRYVGVERGGQSGSDSTAVALIAVDSIAKGAPATGPDGLLRIEFVLVVGSPGYPEKQFADLQRSIPKDPALLYLFSWDSYLRLIHDNLPGWSDRKDLARVYNTIGGDGAIRIVAGRMKPPSSIDGWATTLSEAPIASVLNQIRAAAAGGSS